VAYDAAKQHRALATELRAARKVVEEARLLLENHSAIADCGCRDKVACAMQDYDRTPKAVLDHQPEPSKEQQ
jgi:hypothetical protein